MRNLDRAQVAHEKAAFREYDEHADGIPEPDESPYDEYDPHDHAEKERQKDADLLIGILLAPYQGVSDD